jgi:uncharacterized membrane protein YtjA (UPF0391 family)
MLGLALLFLIVAIAAYFFGAGRAGDMALMIAKVCFVIFLVILVFSLLMGAMSPGGYWGWPFYHYGPPARYPY